jgi:hypothetical protein
MGNKREYDVVKPAREARLALRDIRTSAEKTKKALKENILIEGRMIDGVYNTIVGVTQPLEYKLYEIERWEELEKEKLKAELKAKRIEEISPYGVDTSFTDLGAMTEEAYKAYLETAKLAYSKRLEAQKQAEADIALKNEIEAKERMRIQAENEKLKKEKELQDKKMAAEAEARMKAEAELKEKKRQEDEQKAKAMADAQAKAEAEEKAKQAPDREKIKAYVVELGKVTKPTITDEKVSKRFEQFVTEVKYLCAELYNDLNK